MSKSKRKFYQIARLPRRERLAQAAADELGVDLEGGKGAADLFDDLCRQVIGRGGRPDFNTDTHVFCGYCRQMVVAWKWPGHRNVCRVMHEEHSHPARQHPAGGAEEG